MSIYANVYTGATANDGTGDALRTAFQKIDQNFANLAAVNNTANVVVYASGNANIFATYNPGVTSVAGRYGNVVLGVNDVAGAVSLGTLNSALVASNVYVTGIMNEFTANAAEQIYNDVAANLSTTIADEAAIIAAGQATELTSVQNGLNLANVHIQTLDANLGSLTNTVSSTVNKQRVQDANLGVATNNITALTANAATQTNLINSTNANVTAANAHIQSFDANIGSLNLSVVGLVANAATQGITLNLHDANLGVATNNITALTANAAVQEIEIASLSTRINAANAAVANAGYATVAQLTTNVNTLTSSINTTNNNVAGANAQIRILDANLGTATTNITALQSNAASQAVSINNINSSLSSITTTLGGALNSITLINANLGTATTNITGLQSNASVQAIQIYNLNANVSASNARAQVMDANVGSIYNAFGPINAQLSLINANVAATNVNLASNVSILTANAANQHNQIVSLNANVTAANAHIGQVESDLADLIVTFNNDVNTFTSNDAVQQSQINSVFTLANATAASFSTLTTSIYTGNVAVTGNIKGTNVVASKYYYSNGAPFLGGYGNIQVGQYLPTHIGNVNAGYFTGNGYFLSGLMRSGEYGNTNVQSFLNSNTFAGNLLIPGFVIATNVSVSTAEVGFVSANTSRTFYSSNVGSLITNDGIFWANGDPYSTVGVGSSYTDADVEAYLPTYTGNLTIDVITANVGTFNTSIGAPTVTAETGSFNNVVIAGGSITGPLFGDVVGNVSGINGSFTNINNTIGVINANVTAANIAITTLQSQVFGNANVALFRGNLNPGNLLVGGGTGNMTTGNIVVTYVMRLASLTEAQISSITPGEGMMVYNTTYGNVQAYTAYLGRWGNVVLS